VVPFAHREGGAMSDVPTALVVDDRPSIVDMPDLVTTLRFHGFAASTATSPDVAAEQEAVRLSS
jgi:hypothetical protein